MMQRKMDGVFFVLPSEVARILLTLPPSSVSLYISIISLHRIDEDWQSDPEWVIGKIKASKNEIARQSPLSEATFYRTAWSSLLDSGLIEDKAGGIFITKLKKKSSMTEIDRKIGELERKITKDIQKVTTRLIKAYLMGSDEKDDPQLNLELENSQNESKKSKNDKNHSQNKNNATLKMRVNHSQNENETLKMRVNHSQNESYIYSKNRIYKDKIDLSLSSLSLINKFYVDQKVSKRVRERAEKIIQELQEEYTLEEIDYAIEWTLKNAKEEPYDFSIIAHTIGKALVAKNDSEERKRKEDEKQQEMIRQQETEIEIAENLEKIRAVKEKMTKEEREILRAKALENIEAQGTKRNLVTETLIEIEENRILEHEKEGSSE